ncbi:trypsin-like peptidase domain-containing protein [Botrimarina hoheduenensis]|uniref:Thioredoxin n=1 Tax=Botrimarina hoheduenensis TaxID=2528000 RepID=A0A5C5W8P5_9BACT|nr:trypsin-like peptidase domain-containing protein [Botrimarina hoheduenensis]TWT47268.1 Thioredoxin [Botrimarina hoheduenensis]
MVTHRFTFALYSALFFSTAASAQRVELLDFYLPTCPPCRAMAPTIDRLAAAGLPVQKIDGSRDVGVAQRYGVQSYPTFVAVVDGQERGRIEGATTHAALVQLVQNASAVATQSASPVNQTFAAAPAPGDRSFAVGADHGPGLAPPPVRSVSTGSGSAGAGLIAASVRITVEDPAGRAFGTGTVIDSREGAALVITCAHLFRGADGQVIDTQGRLTLELFDAAASGTPQPIKRVAGHLVSYDMEADVALVSFWASEGLQVARVAAPAEAPRVGDTVASVGCDLGAPPTVRASQVVSLNRYNGPPNLEATGAPVQGRSGGGLFDAAGRLVGVCYAADEAADEGLYAGLASLHAQLDKVGLQELYRSAPSTNLASTNPQAELRAEQQSLLATDAPSRLEPLAAANSVADNTVAANPNDSWPAPVVRGQSPEASAGELARGLSVQERATLAEISRRAASSEVVLMIRANEPGGTTEVVTIDAASPAFVAALRSLGERTEVR